ncbi:MAG: gamma carbonic anhydrase family protein [Lachnospiraceae bacterium]|nr:gamma carbonic anhydrase family protein [Lachnospiraceae bacterium]
MKEYKTEIDPSVFVAPSADILGDVKIGANCGIWYHATIRGDEYPITIGENTNVQDNAVLHVGDGNECHVGNNVTIGHSAIVHGCTVGDNTVIGMGAIIMNGAVVGKNCTIGAGALVTEHKVIPDGSLVMGVPGKVVRTMEEKDFAWNKRNAAMYVQEAKEAKEAQEAKAKQDAESLKKAMTSFAKI